MMHRVSLQEKELSCPVCIDIFEEPKTLPECAHNVCEKCLENIAAMNRRQYIIKCPVCRVESYVPQGGVAKMPTNRFMKTVIDGLPGRKEIQSMKKALEQCEEGLGSRKSHVEDCDRSIACLKTAQQSAHQVKKEIADHAKHLIDIIQKECTRLTNEVDERIGTTSSSLTYLRRERKKTLHTMKESEKIISEAKGIIKRGNIQEIIEKKDETVSKLHENTSLLAINHMISFPEVPDSMRFIKANEIRTGKQLLGWIRKDHTADEYHDLEYIEDWFPQHSILPCHFRGRLQSMPIAALPGFARVPSPPPRRSSLSLPFTNGSDYTPLPRSRSPYSCPIFRSSTLPPPPTPRRS